MKIYFAGSIRGGREDQDWYAKLIKSLQKHGEVLTEHIGSETLEQSGEARIDSNIYTRDLAWIQEADVIVAEVSTPSLGVGYEIGKAEALGKKILCLYHEGSNKKLSGMVGGNSNLTIARYATNDEALQAINYFFTNLKSE